MMVSWAERMHRRAAFIGNVVTSCGYSAAGGPYPRRIEKVKFGVPLEQLCRNGIPGPLLVLMLKLNKEAPFRKDVFRAPGHQAQMKQLIHFLQQGRLVNLDKFSVHTIASVMKKFLRKIPGGIFGPEVESILFSIFENETPLSEKRIRIHNLISGLSEVSQHLLVLMFGTFRLIAAHADSIQTGMTAEALGVSVAPSLFQSCVSDGRAARMEDVRRFKVASHITQFLIQNFGESDLFGRSNYEYYAKITGRILRVDQDWIFSFKYPSDLIAPRLSLSELQRHWLFLECDRWHATRSAASSPPLSASWAIRRGSSLRKHRSSGDPSVTTSVFQFPSPINKGLHPIDTRPSPAETKPLIHPLPPPPPPPPPAACTSVVVLSPPSSSAQTSDRSSPRLPPPPSSRQASPFPETRKIQFFSFPHPHESVVERDLTHGDVDSQSTPALLNASVIGLVEKGMEGESLIDMEGVSVRLSTSLDEGEMRRSCSSSSAGGSREGLVLTTDKDGAGSHPLIHFGGSMSLEQLRRENLRAESSKGLTYLPMVSDKMGMGGVHERQAERLRTRSEWFLRPAPQSPRRDPLLSTGAGAGGDSDDLTVPVAKQLRAYSFHGDEDLSSSPEKQHRVWSDSPQKASNTPEEEKENLFARSRGSTTLR
ncbi:unnamed protein product [Cyprideis torosa]|uniref:Uncharacterized protein n=1 Tax=Cyprideis torosa TaxID=163714 RepID=A0A7R8W944_9CRUS|nr:unnamed protein product [Cyprideis torosa]CAG0886939.1 unnamed protein product [Cyprideis torosa]